MKKLLFLTITLLSISFTQMQAQSAIGARLTNGAEISYQTKAFGSRIEIDLGLNLADNDNKYINITGLYQVVKNIEGGFNWYYGVGANVAFTDEVGIGAAGNLGVEYNFGAPFQLSLDWRPILGLIPATKFYGSEFGLGIRYRF